MSHRRPAQSPTMEQKSATSALIHCAGTQEWGQARPGKSDGRGAATLGCGLVVESPAQRTKAPTTATYAKFRSGVGRRGGGGSVSTQTGVRRDQNHMAVCPFDRGTGAVQRREREDGAMVTLPSHTHTPGRFDIEGHSGDRALYEDGGRRWCYRKQEIPGLALLFRQTSPGGV